MLHRTSILRRSSGGTDLRTTCARSVLRFVEDSVGTHAFNLRMPLGAVVPYDGTQHYSQFASFRGSCVESIDCQFELRLGLASKIDAVPIPAGLNLPTDGRTYDL